MATHKDFASQYARRLADAFDRKAEAELIAREIKNLVDANTQRPLTTADRRLIVENMRPEKGGVFVKAADNQAYIAMVNYIMQLIEGS